MDALRLLVPFVGIAADLAAAITLTALAAGAVRWRAVRTVGCARYVAVSWIAAAVVGVVVVSVMFFGDGSLPISFESAVWTILLGILGGGVVGLLIVPATAAVGILANARGLPRPAGAMLMGVTAALAGIGPASLYSFGAEAAFVVAAVVVGVALSLAVSAELPWRGGFLRRSRRSTVPASTVPDPGATF